MADTTPKKSKKDAQKPEIAASQAIPEPSQTQEGAPPKKKTGRPSKYDPDIAKQMCEQLSEGVPLREICRQEGFPAWRTVYDWMAKDQELSTAIAYARDIGYDALAEDCLLIADNPVFGEEITEEATTVKETKEDGKTVEVPATLVKTKKSDMLGHRRLQIETRLKLLAKFNPKKYGDRVQLAGDAESPLAVTADVGLFDTILKSLEAKRQVANEG